MTQKPHMIGEHTTNNSSGNKHLSMTVTDLIKRMRAAVPKSATIHERHGFTRTFKQASMSLTFNLGGLFAGFLMVSFFNVITIVSWGVLLYPGVLSVRGVLGGIFSGRISSGLHTGTIMPSMRKNTHEFGMLWRALVIVAVQSAILLTGFAMAIGTFTVGFSLDQVVGITIVISTTLTLSLVLVSPITAAVSFRSFQKGMDPDVIVYPIMSTVADILVTLIYILTMWTYHTLALGMIITMVPAAGLFLASALIFAANHRDGLFERTLRESVVTIVLITMIVNVTGSILDSVNRVFGEKPEIYMIYPALIDTMGDVGSVVGSTATTRIALGSLRPSPRSIKQHGQQIAAAIAAGLVLCTMFLGITTVFQSLPVTTMIRFTMTLYVTGLLATSVMSTIAFMVAILTYERGWDPDNFVIPVESSLADTTTSAILLLVMIILAY